MSDNNNPGATMDRRQMTKLMMLVSGGMALSPFAAASASTGNEGFKDSAEELLAFMKMQSRTDTGYTEYFNSGTVYAAIPGRAPLAMYGYEGLLRFYTRVVGKNLFEVTFIEAGTYLDLATGKRMDSFKNPVTGVSNAVDHIVEGPLTWQWTAENLKVKEPFPIVRRRVEWQHFAGESWLYFDNILTGGGFGNPANLVTHIGSTAQLRDKSRNRVDNVVLVDSSINPWAAWLKMGDTPGRSSTAVVGRKLGALSEAPARLTKYIAAKHPKVLEGVEGWATARQAT